MRRLTINGKRNYIFGLFMVCVIVILAWYISGNYYQLLLISGNSMLPAFHDLQIVILDKHSKKYNYNDVVAFRCDGLNAVLVKRIVACPGDTVWIDAGTLYVNGSISTVFPQENQFEYEGITQTALHLEKNQYFLVGDNITESKDSRYEEVVCVEEKDMIGKVIE